MGLLQIVTPLFAISEGIAALPGLFNTFVPAVFTSSAILDPETWFYMLGQVAGTSIGAVLG